VVRGLLGGVTVAMSVMAAALPVFLFALVPGKAAWMGAGGGTTVMTVRGSPASVEARLAAGRLRSPCCGVVLARWGWARRRVVATFSGPLELRPRRGRCHGCGRTHVLLPAVLWSRRRYGAAVIMAVLVLAAAPAAAGRAAARPWLAGRDGSRWLVPASTAWSWRSRFAGRAAALREGLMALLPAAAGPGAARALAPAGSAAGDCLAALEAVTAGLRRFGGLAAVAAHEVAAHLTGGMWLAPAVPAVGFNTSLDAAGVIAPS
jgi:Domain of unknown function (DUF6431)